MKKLMLFLLLIVCTFVGSQTTVPAPDRDIGGITYVMPTFQVEQAYVVASLPTPPTLYFDTSSGEVVGAATNARPSEQCNLMVVPAYKGPRINAVDCNPTNYKRPNFT